MSEANTAEANGNQADSANTNDEQSWNGLRSAILGHFPELNSEDIDKLKGRVNKLVQVVKDKYAINTEEARRKVSEFEQTLEDSASEIYRSASEGVSNRYYSVRDGVSEFADEVRIFGFGPTVVNVAREYPVTSFVTAFVLGALVAGTTVRSRRRRWY